MPRRRAEEGAGIEISRSGRRSWPGIRCDADQALRDARREPRFRTPRRGQRSQRITRPIRRVFPKRRVATAYHAQGQPVAPALPIPAHEGREPSDEAARLRRTESLERKRSRPTVAGLAVGGPIGVSGSIGINGSGVVCTGRSMVNSVRRASRVVLLKRESDADSNRFKGEHRVHQFLSTPLG